MPARLRLDLPPNPRMTSICVRGARVSAAAAGTLALTALPARLLEAEGVAGTVTSHVTMEPGTAAGLLLLAFALAVATQEEAPPRLRHAARVAAAAATFLGALALAHHATGLAPGFDRPPPSHGASGDLPALDTALATVLAGLAQQAVLGRRYCTILAGQALSLAVMLIGLLRLYTLAGQMPEPAELHGLSDMAVNTALALVLTGAGTFLARPGGGLTAVVTSDSTTALLGRWMLVSTLVVPPALAWVGGAGRRHGLYDMRTGVALHVIGDMLVFTVISFCAVAIAGRAEAGRMRAERAERAMGNYARLQALMDHTPAAIFMKDLEGRYLAVNSLFEWVMGVTREGVVGLTNHDLLPPEVADRLRLNECEVVEAGRAVQFDDVIPHADGPHHYLTILFPLADESGRVHTVCGIATDVTDRVHTRREHEQLQRRFRELLESAPDAMVIVDGDGRITLVNAQAETVFGYRREELLGAPVEMLVPEGFRDRHRGHRRAYAAHPQVRPMGAGHELRGRGKDGREFPIEISLSPLQTEDGVLVSAAVRDVTERKLAEEELLRVYEQQRHVALTLQRSLMALPPEVPGMGTASRYLPSTQGAGVGGDWFDLIPLGGGRVGVLIGDVMGRGLEAAAVMGHLRSAAHALAKTGMAPRHLMRALDELVADLPEQLVTCYYLVADPVRGEATACSAGHPPVLLVTPDLSVSALPAPVSVPLGVGGVPHRQASFPVREGSTFVFYTDGLVESPGSDIESRIETMITELGAAFTAAAKLEEVADHVLTRMIPEPEGHEDDVTLLLARFPEMPATSVSTTYLHPEPTTVAAGRRFLSTTLSRWRCRQAEETARLLLSELLTNAVCHAKGPLTLSLHRTARELTVEVTDRSPELPRLRIADATDEDGRGLLLIDALADSWGTTRADEGKTVWFTMRLASPT
ncbi:hypothetical protein GCM10010517_36080 [Streptosporangium fragile]|uniref:Histidine kinase n=1 Tax=Streptosporangium fragile TaxID=46186 RepID=A0ABN3VYT6_9ACTN